MRRWLGFAALVGVLVAVSMGFSPNATTSSTKVDTTWAPSETFFPTASAPVEPNRLRSGEAEAILSLGATGAGIPTSDPNHSHTDVVAEVALSTTDARAFAAQWNPAGDAISKHDTEAKAAALGYVRATAPAGGIGTHWVLWLQIANPFDPAVPSMLLFDDRRDPAALVGYSYAL